MLSLFKRKRHSGIRAGIALNERELALALVRRRPGQLPAVEHLSVHAAGDDLAGTLATVLNGLHLAHASLCAAIGRDDYQLVQVETPEVLPSELRAAVRWKLRDAINFHLDDAVVDVFEIPDQSRRAQAKMMFAVAARSAAVQRITKALNPIARGFDTIDIPELCLRNVASLLPQDQRGVAVLALCERFAQLILTRQGVLYLARRIELARSYDLSLDTDADAAGIDAAALALELQRSLDYYESHFDQTPIGDLVIVPGDARAHALASALKSEVSLKIATFDPTAVLEMPQGADAASDLLGITALGAALRIDELEL